MRKDMIGSFLLDERKKQGKTLRDLAAELDYSISTLSSMEHGVVSVGDEKYVEYAKCLGVAKSLFGLEDQMVKREKEIMKELKRIEDISSGNPKVAWERLNAIADIHHYLDATTFARFIKSKNSLSSK